MSRLLAEGVEAELDLRRPLPPFHFASIDAEFRARAADSPTRIALVDDTGRWSFQALESAAARLGSRLASLGVARGDAVAIVTERSASFVCALLAVLRVGAAFTVLDDAYPDAQIRARLAVARPKLTLLVGKAGRFEAQLGEKGLLLLPSSLESLIASLSSEVELASSEPGPDSIAYLTFTSGSTGTPKCIATGHAPLPHFVAFHRRRFGLDADDHFSLLSGLSHDPLLRDIFTPLSIGATLHVPAQELLTDPARLFAWLGAEQITVCHLTPALGQVIELGAAAGELPGLRWLFWGGDVLRLGQVRAFASIAPRAAHVNFYGTSETPQAVGYHVVDPAAAYPEGIPVGSGIDDFELLVLNGALQLAPVGEEGEVVIRSRYLSQGYFADRAETERKYLVNAHTSDPADRFYRTGDRGSLRADSTVRFLGRADDQVKVRGFRVELEEITAVLRAANEQQVLDALTLARPLASGEPQIVVFVVRRSGQTPTAVALLASVRAALPRYAHPAGVAVLDAFPLLPNGKVDRLALLALAVSTRTEAATQELSAREQQLKQLWAELLGAQDISVNESFYDLGGDSLTALRVLVRMQTLGLAPELCRGILQGKTIAELANADSGEGGTSGPPPRDHQSRLLLNVLRGLLIVLLVLCHWIPPLLGRLPPSLLRAAGYSFALFNWPTPGFAIAFGMTLGFVYAPMYQQHPARVRALLWRGALFVAAGTLIYAAVQLLVNRLAVDWYFHPLGSVLTFYTLAMLSAPLWLALTATGAHRVEKALGLSLILMLLHHAARRVHLSEALTFQLQPVLGKYSYLAMSSGALAGIAAGLSLKRRGRVPAWYVLAGLGLVLLGLSWSWGQGRAGQLLVESKDVELEKWLLYGGLLLLVLGPLDRVLGWVLRVGQRCKSCAQGVATLGQLALPICVLDFVSRDLGKLLELTGARSGARMLGTGLAFGLLAYVLLRKTYRLYYGGEPSQAG